MWYCPDKYNKDIPNVNQELLKLKGDLLDKEAKVSLAKFLRANLGFTTLPRDNTKRNDEQKFFYVRLGPWLW